MLAFLDTLGIGLITFIGLAIAAYLIESIPDFLEWVSNFEAVRKTASKVFIVAGVILILVMIVICLYMLGSISIWIFS